jgi:Lrp/AsnC family leucine-responsive transcriptional regulator
MARTDKKVVALESAIAAGKKQKREHVLDDIDYAILNLLQDNNNKTHEQVSRMLSNIQFQIKGAAVGNRIDALRANGYIARDCVIIDYAKFNAPQMYILIVKMKNKDENTLNEFLISAKGYDEIFEIHEMAGAWDYLIKLRVTTLADATEISKKLSQKIADIETHGVAITRKETTVMRVPRRPRTND